MLFKTCDQLSYQYIWPTLVTYNKSCEWCEVKKQTFKQELLERYSAQLLWTENPHVPDRWPIFKNVLVLAVWYHTSGTMASLFSAGMIRPVAHRYTIFVWRRHDNMSLYNGSRVNSDHERFASCAGCQEKPRPRNVTDDTAIHCCIERTNHSDMTHR